jgi:hypothetical protein
MVLARRRARAAISSSGAPTEVMTGVGVDAVVGVAVLDDMGVLSEDLGLMVAA